MPRVLRGRVVNNDIPRRISRAMAANEAPPAGFPTWRSYQLAEGLKIAIDYLNLPNPPAGERYKNGVFHRNRQSAVTHARRAREWSQNCKYTPSFQAPT